MPTKARTHISEQQKPQPEQWCQGTPESTNYSFKAVSSQCFAFKNYVCPRVHYLVHLRNVRTVTAVEQKSVVLESG